MESLDPPGRALEASSSIDRLQRCLRDIQAGSQHIVASDESWERFGQVWLGVGEPAMVEQPSGQQP